MGYEDDQDCIVESVREIGYLRDRVAELEGKAKDALSERFVQAVWAGDLVKDVGEVLDAFDSGIFVRSTEQDSESGWAMKMLGPLAALGRLKAASDAAKGEG